MLDILASHLDAFAQLAPLWGYVLIFFFMAVESSFIPFPSEVVMIPAGFMAARGELSCHMPLVDVSLAVLAGVAGSLAGAFFNYYLSLHLGEPFLRQYGKWFWVKNEDLDRASKAFVRHGEGTTFVCRLIPVIRQLISIPAGIAHMPIGRFALFTGLGAGLWTLILALTGYSLGRGARHLSYLELVHQGKALVEAHLMWIILGGVLLVTAYHILSRLAQKCLTKS